MAVDSHTLMQAAQDLHWSTLLMAGGLALAVWLAHVSSRRFLLPLVRAALGRGKISWDDALLRHKVPESVLHLVPVLVLYYGSGFFPAAEPVLRRAVHILVAVVLVRMADKLLSVFLDVYQDMPIAQRRPVKGYVELVKLFAYVLGGVAVFSLVLDTSPWGLLSGIGALTAVLMLVFKDTILCFVASLQIARYDLVREGDWIEMPAFGADGDVVDMALHTIKVQNFDKTIVAVPTHRFLDSSFKNWRGMREAGGRRIKRSVLIDQSSIGFADEALLERLGRLRLLRDYVAERERAIEEWNLRAHADRQLPVDGRRLTNLGLFRRYLEAYLQQHPHVRRDLTLMVRQLQPEADKGLPLEIYCFADTTDWIEYEAVQSDIFDHVLAAIPEFGLRSYQRGALLDTRSPGPDGEG